VYYGAQPVGQTAPPMYEAVQPSNYPQVEGNQPPMYTMQPGQPPMYMQAQPMGMQMTPGPGGSMQMQPMGVMAQPMMAGGQPGWTPQQQYPGGVYAGAPMQGVVVADAKPVTWIDGLFDCFKDCGTCLCAWFCAPCRFATTVSRAKVFTYGVGLTLFGVCYLLIFLAGIYGNKKGQDAQRNGTSAGGAYVAVTYAALAGMVIVAFVARRKIRYAFFANPNGNPRADCEDFFSSCLCLVCSLAQEARSVDLWTHSPGSCA